MPSNYDSIWELEREREEMERLEHTKRNASDVSNKSSQTLGELKDIARGLGVSIYWDKSVDELELEVVRIGAPLIKKEFTSYAQWIANAANVTVKVISWDKFFTNRLLKAAPVKKEQGPVRHVKYDLDAWYYMIDIQHGRVPVSIEAMDILNKKWLVYPDGHMKDHIKRYIDAYCGDEADNKEHRRNPDIEAQLEVFNWYDECVRTVPAHFQHMVASITTTHIRESCERRIKDRLSNPLPIKKPPINNLFVKAPILDTVTPILTQLAANHDENVDRISSFFNVNENDNEALYFA